MNERHLGDEHIMLALLRDEAGAGGAALEALGVTRRAVADAVLAAAEQRGRNVRSRA